MSKKMKKLSEIEAEGFSRTMGLMIHSSERESEKLSESDLKVDDPDVVSSIGRLINYHKKESNYDELIKDGGEWKLYFSRNDIGWGFIDVGYFAPKLVTEMFKCLVISDDGTEKFLFLREEMYGGNKKYFDAEDKEYTGKILKKLMI